MHISNIEIQNFRNLKHCSLDLGPGLNVIVGRNNVGKSNLVDAVRHALGGPSPSPSPLQEQDFRLELGRPQPITIRVTFSAMSQADRTNFFEMLVPDLVDLANSRAELVFEANWTSRRRASIRRWCGPATADRPVLPAELLEALPVTFLPALRDAEAALTPGYRNRLALLLDDITSESEKKALVEIFAEANLRLEKEGPINVAQSSIRDSARRLAGTDFLEPSVRAAEPSITRVLRTLRLTLDEGPVSDVAGTGLGYQNILYIATVLAHLTKSDPRDCPLLIVEEPEAHVHPQLVVLLGASLSGASPGSATPQTLVTTHSPTFVSHVAPDQVVIMHSDAHRQGTCRSLARARFEPKQARALQRMLDVTRSALYFAKGVILVEGVCEALLIPVFAKRLGHNLDDLHISVIPICGVAFGTLAKLLQDDVLGIPVAVVSDSDPKVQYPGRQVDWKTALPERDDSGFVCCPRITRLLEVFAEHALVKVFSSKVTLEYDLADAGDRNPEVMAMIWESVFVGTPRTLTEEMVRKTESHSDQVLAVWRGICVADHSGSKAEFAHLLAEELELELEEGLAAAFDTPSYIREAVEFVTRRVPKHAEPVTVEVNGEEGKGCAVREES